MQLAEAVERFLRSLDGVKSAATVKWYHRRLSALAAFLGQQETADVTTDDLRRWRATYNGRVSVWTLHGYVRAVRRLFRWLVDEGLLTDSPARRLELPRLPEEPRKGISDNDRDKIIEAARQTGPRDYALVLFLADTLCRVGGLVGLRVFDLDLDAGEALVHEKGDKSRTVFILDDTVDALRAWLKERGDPGSHYVFTGKKGRLSTWGIYQILERLAKSADVKRNWNPHNWRHGGARGMLQRGASLGHVSQILGHSGIDVTNRFYGTFARSELKAAHRKYGRRITPKDF